MVYKLKPLELSFDFEDRLYELGDQINVRVTLTPSGDINVREARVDLVCEERYSRQESGVRAGSLGAAGIQGGKLVSTTDYVPASSWVSQRTESYVHSSVVFLNDVTLSSGRPGTYDATLQIQPTPPAHLEDAGELQRDSRSSWTFKWRVTASANIVRGRDPKRQRTVKLRLPQAHIEAKPTMSTPKKTRTRRSS